MVRPSRRGRNRPLLSTEVSTGVVDGDDIDWPVGTYGEPTADAHIADATDAHDASAVSYDPTSSGLTATDVQAAIDELAGGSVITELDDIPDVNAATPSDGDVLTWDSTPGEWVAAAPTGGSGAVATDTIWDAKGDLAVGTGADTAAKLTVGTNGYVLTADSAQATGVKWAAPGSSSAWTQVVNEDGTSFTNWNGVSGTWSSDGTVIKQTNTAATDFRAILTTPLIAVPHFIMEAEIQWPTTGAAAVPNYAGFVLGSPNSNTNHPHARFKRDTSSIAEVGVTSVAVYLTSGTITLNLDTWYTLRALVSGSSIAIYRNGTLLGTGLHNRTGDISYIGLYTNKSLAWFRNIKVWTLTQP